MSCKSTLLRVIGWLAISALAMGAPALWLAWPMLPPPLDTGIVAANGASTIIFDQAQGPYRVVIGITPARPVIPQTHLAIQVLRVDDEQLLDDRAVQVTLAASGPSGAPDFGPQAIYHEDSPRYFEADVPFPRVGLWDVSVNIVSADYGEATFWLPLEVGEPPLQIQWVWIAGVLVGIVVVGMWTVWKMGRRQPDEP